MNRKVSAQMGVPWTCVAISTPADSSLYFFCWYGRLVFRDFLLVLNARSPLEDDSAPS